MNDRDSRLLSEAYNSVYKKTEVIKESGYTPVTGGGDNDFEWQSKDGYNYFVNYSYDAQGRSYSKTYDEPAYTDASFDIDIDEITRWKEGMDDAEVIYSGQNPKDLSPEALEIYKTAIENIDDHLRDTVELEPDYDQGQPDRYEDY